jgi:diguanylate cyclase (GGDEF)-like protein
VSHALALAQRASHPITVLFLDLDDFKRVNDSLGHAEGDRLLVAAAERFLSCARAADTVARLGGDEFAILIEHAAGADGRGELLERLATAMGHPFTPGSTRCACQSAPTRYRRAPLVSSPKRQAESKSLRTRPRP